MDRKGALWSIVHPIILLGIDPCFSPPCTGLLLHPYGWLTCGLVVSRRRTLGERCGRRGDAGVTQGRPELTVPERGACSRRHPPRAYTQACRAPLDSVPGDHAPRSDAPWLGGRPLPAPARPQGAGVLRAGAPSARCSDCWLQPASAGRPSGAPPTHQSVAPRQLAALRRTASRLPAEKPWPPGHQPPEPAHYSR